MSQFKLEIVTPDRKFLEADVSMLVARTIDGDMAILKNHIPLVTPLDIGIIKMNYEDGTSKKASIAGGYMEVTKEKTTIVTESAEWPEEIDRRRAEEAKKRAEERISKKNKDTDVLRAELALKRAINRIRLGD
ncbi:F-ATPase, F1 complex, subunit epsilon AtpC [Gottschalkia acidurici 9a]|uniref:ATP synthase epsilon chain n=1 Tax=Gottschalkia acidurici (strain ATCC 7906 / DSM 604 / BCRC 14475 / CIP 104303 / KCTC 5404 / NCIMB 10678 / 9a) TaxID=1128398 RepID=K0AY12_GOTA9|nr:F0F1 ATP synthase subunit epsilon [Gottschalkia acidurici]AFS77286.1 F-ATPase, F1 complex, subunit epsilon AtpC [Gottschalkia acidurici 9a]